MNEKIVFKGKYDNYTPVSVKPFAFGRTAAVWKALNRKNEAVCVKQFYSYTTFGEDNNSFNRMKTELKALTYLNHPNILKVLDYNFDEKKSFIFITLPLCEGDLRQILNSSQFISYTKIIEIAEQISSAIDTAHRKGIIHGDIKPENILYLNNGSNFLLADFSISKFTGFQEEITLDQSNRSGTTNYLSPERLQELSITTSSDIYSLAVVVYEMFTGMLPFNTKLPPLQQMQSKVNGEIKDPITINPNIDKDIAEVLKFSLSVNPLNRPKSATELCSYLKKELPLMRSNTTMIARVTKWEKLSEANKIALVVGIITALSVIIAALL